MFYSGTPTALENESEHPGGEDQEGDEGHHRAGEGRVVGQKTLSLEPRQVPGRAHTAKIIQGKTSGRHLQSACDMIWETYVSITQILIITCNAFLSSLSWLFLKGRLPSLLSLSSGLVLTLIPYLMFSC